MHARLNVTEAERLCYSYRKLQAISALRSAGIDPTIFGLHKDYRVPGVRGRVYVVQHPGGSAYAFLTLDELHIYAAEYRAWKRPGHFVWDQWRKLPPKLAPGQAACSWPDCPYGATGRLEGEPVCPPHAFIYGQMLLARDKRAAW